LQVGILAAKLGFFPRETRPDPASLKSTVWGREFPNPLGRWAGRRVRARVGGRVGWLVVWLVGVCKDVAVTLHRCCSRQP